MITKFLSDSEVITVAMNLEEEGYKFYEEAARISRHKETRDIFNRLRDDEVEHYKTFKGLLEALPGGDSREYFNLGREEISAYLNSLIETGVFKAVDKNGMKKMDEIKALEIGIEAEKGSVLFYTEAERASVSPKGREILSKIIDMEKEHMVTLTKRLRVARKLF